MSQFRSFAPWIVYPAASALFGWQAGCAAAFGFCVVGVCLDGRPATTDPFRVAALVFFGALTGIAFLTRRAQCIGSFPPSSRQRSRWRPRCRSLLARPFTVAFAKRVAPQEFWEMPLFADINVVLTTVWATSFAVTAAVLATGLTVAPHDVAILIGGQVAGFVVPMRITRWYPAKARSCYASV